MKIESIGAGGIYSPSALRSNLNNSNDNENKFSMNGENEGIRLNDRYEPSTPVPANENVNPADKKNEDKLTVTTVNTDRVDRELDSLKEKKQDLEQSIIKENNTRKRKLLERSLRRLSSEITRRDNEAYRRQHADVM